MKIFINCTFILEFFILKERELTEVPKLCLTVNILFAKDFSNKI